MSKYVFINSLYSSSSLVFEKISYLSYIYRKVGCHLCKLESIAKRSYIYTDEQPTYFMGYSKLCFYVLKIFGDSSSLKHFSLIQKIVTLDGYKINNNLYKLDVGNQNLLWKSNN